MDTQAESETETETETETEELVMVQQSLVSFVPVFFYWPQLIGVRAWSVYPVMRTVQGFLVRVESQARHLPLSLSWSLESAL